MLPQRYVDEGKRVRCALAVAEVAHEEGAARVTTAAIVKRAGVSRNTFYGLFDSVEESLRFACRLAGAWLSRPVVEATESEGPWPTRLRAAIDALLGEIAERPLTAELYLVHAPRLLGAQMRLQSSLSEPLSAVLAEGAERGQLRDRATDGVAELAAFGIVSVIATRMQRGETDTLPGLRDELIAVASASVGAGTEPGRRLEAVEGDA